MAAASISKPAIARAAQLVGFSVVAVALAVVSWRTTSLDLPGVGQFAGIIGSGFLGGIINPLIKTLNGFGVGADVLSAAVARQHGNAVQVAQMTQVTQDAEAAQDAAAAALAQKSDWVWEVAVVIGAVTIVVAALALAIDGNHHVNAAAALTALATAFGALFVNTSKITHTAAAS